MSNKDQPISISELSQQIKLSLEKDFLDINIIGEIGKVTLASSGHIYLDLKDEDAVINAIIWRGTYVGFEPKTGMEVIAKGRVSTFPPRSNYQFIVSSIEESGVGKLLLLFEETRKKLSKEGLFDEDRKKPLPFLPNNIAIITSKTGAVIKDMIHRMLDRKKITFNIFPVAVQGKEALGQILNSLAIIKELPKDGVVKPDLIIIARGGGSFEDLWVFNEEALVREIAKSEIPIISAIGHETDYSLCDMVADKRAPTPTAAIEIALPRDDELKSKLSTLCRQIERPIINIIENNKDKMNKFHLIWQNTKNIISFNLQKIDYISQKLLNYHFILQKKKDALQLFSNKLENHNPEMKIIQHKEKYITMSNSFDDYFNKFINDRKSKFEFYKSNIENNSFEKTLKRGYAIIKDKKNNVLANISKVSSANIINIKMHDGEIKAKIKNSDKNIQGNLFNDD